MTSELMDHASIGQIFTYDSEENFCPGCQSISHQISLFKTMLFLDNQLDEVWLFLSCMRKSHNYYPKQHVKISCMVPFEPSSICIIMVLKTLDSQLCSDHDFFYRWITQSSVLVEQWIKWTDCGNVESP